MSEYRNGMPMMTGYDCEKPAASASGENGACIVNLCFDEAISVLRYGTRSKSKKRKNMESYDSND